MKRLGAFGLLVFLLAGCQGGETTTDAQQAGVVACEPLASEDISVQLGQVLGAGKSADGTLYVIDEIDMRPRLFIGDSDELVLQVESGSGETNDGDGMLLSLSFVEREPPLIVELWQGNDGTSRLGVVKGELPPGTKQFEIGALGEELQPVAEDDWTGLAVRADRVAPVVEYAANVADDRLLVVLRPEHFESYAEFRVFFGTLDHLDERSGSEVQRARDGGSTTIAFDVDGQTAVASFPIVSDGEMFMRGPPALMLGMNEVGIEPLPDVAAPDGANYYCAK